MVSIKKITSSIWFTVLYIIGAIGLLLYLKYDFPKVVVYYISFFLGIRLLADKKWIQLIVLICLISAVIVGTVILK